MKDNFIKILKAKNTVFSYSDLAYYFWNNKDSLLSKISYYRKKGYLYKIKRWLYSLDRNYNAFELATKIQKWSYISLETALGFHSINFQYDSNIFVIWYKNEERLIDWKKIIFKVLKKEIRENFEWVISKNSYVIADKYRAILDTLYLYKDFFFDNLDEIDFKLLLKLSKKYNSKILEQRIINLKNNQTNNEYYN